MRICRPVEGEGLADQDTFPGIEQVMALLAGCRAVTLHITEAGNTNRRGREVPSSFTFRICDSLPLGQFIKSCYPPMLAGFVGIAFTMEPHKIVVGRAFSRWP